MQRAIILVVILLGCPALFWLIDERQRIAKLRAPYLSIAKSWGEFEIIDPNEFHVRLLPQTSSDEFVWRIYCPHNNLVHSINQKWAAPATRASKLISASPFVTYLSEKEILFRIKIKNSYVIPIALPNQSLTVRGLPRSSRRVPSGDQFLSTNEVRIVGMHGVERFNKNAIVPLMISTSPQDVQPDPWPYALPAKIKSQISIGSTDAYEQWIDILEERKVQ